MELYRRVVIFLKKKFPQKYPVSVRRTAISNLYDGDCSIKNKTFKIRINKKLPEYAAIDTLLHEYAHCVAWDKCSCEEHCNEWGKAYSKLYRAFLKEFIDY